MVPNMSIKSICIKVPKKNGQETLILARKLKTVNLNLEIQRDQHFIYIPILNKSSETLKTLKEKEPGIELCERIFQTAKKREKSLVEQVERDLPSNLLAGLPHSMDIIGDIAIIEILQDLDNYRELIGEAILHSHKNIHTVLAKAGPVSGPYRLRQFTVVAGEPKTTTVHKEHGCSYYVDISKAYFSPRLSTEHSRISSLVEEGEVIVDLFTGVGPFAIQVAKNHKDVSVYAIDVNPDAIEYFRKNARLNRVDGKVHPYLGDAKQVAREKLSEIADRIVMNLPEKAIDYVDVACETLKLQGGVIHFYGFATADCPVEALRKRFVEAVQKSRREVICILCRHVRETAPFEAQVVFDARIR